MASKRVVVPRGDSGAKVPPRLQREDSGRSVAAQLAMNVHGVPEANDYLKRMESKEKLKKARNQFASSRASSTKLSLSELTLGNSNPVQSTPLPLQTSHFRSSKSYKSSCSLGSMDLEAVMMDMDHMVNSIIGNLDDITEDELAVPRQFSADLKRRAPLKRSDTVESETARDEAIQAARNNAFQWDSWVGENDELDNYEEPEWANEETPEWADADMDFSCEFDFEASRKMAEGMFSR
jgi:hypothetical protein